MESQKNSGTGAKKQRKETQEEGKIRLLRKQNRKQESDDEQYEVGEFVTAVYEDEWLVAQVDIDQSKAGNTHVNLNYMEQVGYNQFKWPKNYDILLTLREDILTRCPPPGLVSSSIRANHVGLNAKDAHAADVALAAVFYLQPNFYLGCRSRTGVSPFPSTGTYGTVLFHLSFLFLKFFILFLLPPPLDSSFQKEGTISQCLLGENVDKKYRYR